MTNALSLYLAVAAAAEKAPDPDDVKPGWLGFGVFILLALALVVLWFSLRKHLGRVDFDEEDPGSAERPRRTNGDGHTTQA
jgi:hypothetical protein